MLAMVAKAAALADGNAEFGGAFQMDSLPNGESVNAYTWRAQKNEI